MAGEVVALVRLLGLLRDANLAATPPLVPTSAFYSPFLSEKLDMQQDYVSWAQYGPAERGVPLSVPWSGDMGRYMEI